MTNKMDLSPIFGVYSMRNQNTGDAVKPLTPEFRNRVWLFCQEMVHPYDHYAQVGHKIADFWMTLQDKLRYRHGLYHLLENRQPTVITEVEKFLSECSDEHFLDFIEMFFQSEVLPMHFSDRDLDGAVKNINTFFDQDDLPYALTGYVVTKSRPVKSPIVRLRSLLGPKPSPPMSPMTTSSHSESYSEPFRNPVVQQYPRIIPRQGESVHQTAIEPALTLLAQPHFASANKEFLDAISDYRKGDYGDCITKCGSSFESVMKVVCDRKKWQYKQTDTAATLLGTILQKSNLKSFFNQPLTLIATMRNHLSSAHGAGGQARDVPKHIAQYAVNATASAILLLVEETKP